MGARMNSAFAMTRIWCFRPTAITRQTGSLRRVWLAQNRAPPSGICSLPIQRQGWNRLKNGHTMVQMIAYAVLMGPIAP